MTVDLTELKRSVDMVALLTNYGVELKQRGAEYDALCIWHTETRPSMQVYVKDGVNRVHCKSCGRGGTVIDVVMEMDNCDEAQAIAKLKANGFQRDDTRIKAEAPIKPAKWQHQVAPAPLTDFDVKDRTYVKHWTYLDATGALLGYVVRYLQPDGSKDYRPWTFGSYSENASAKWASKTWTHGRRPLYGLDLLASNPQGKVVICYADDTEVLTKNGWRLFQELEPADLIAQYNKDTEEVSFVVPSARQKFSIDDEMVHFSADWCDMLVTKDHRVLSKAPHHRPNIKLAKDIKRRCLPVSGVYVSTDSSGSPNSYMARLCAAYQADGRLGRPGNHAYWRLKKERKVERIKQLIVNCNGSYDEMTYKSTPGWVDIKLDKLTTEKLKELLPEKTWHFGCLDWHVDSRSALLDELRYWDGDSVGKIGIRFFTSDKINADVISSMCAITGYSCTSRIDRRPDRERSRDAYVLNIGPKTWKQLAAKPSLSKYKGDVYCCTVETGFIVTRRNGKTTISGNCEGEKAADAARHYWTSRIGIAWPGGANAIAGVDWQPLAGRDVLLIPDADISGAGVSAMYNVTSYLLPLGCKVSILDTSDKPNKWDVADALAEGMSKDDLMAWAAQRVVPLTSNELEKQRVKEEKKTMQSAQAVSAKPYKEFDEDSSIYELPPLEDEPQHIPMTIDVVPEQIPDAPAVQPAKVKRHTAIKEEMVLQPGSPFSDRRMAEIFAENDGIDWQYCHGWEKWLQWDGNRWEIDQTRSACRIVSKLTQAAEYWPQADQLSAKDKRALSSVGKITSVLKAATWIPELKKLPKDFDADTFLLGTPGGTVDLRTGILRESKREDWITKQTAVTPQAGPMPLWEKMLDRCTMGDPAMRTYYQKWAGYALTGDTREKGFLFVHGAQDSGKTSFLTTLKSMLGEYAAEIKVDILMEQKYGGAAAHDLAELYGIRLAMTTEPQSGHRWNESLVKSMTGGEELQACRKYEHPFSFKVTHKIFMGGNEKPMLSSADGMERRLHIAEFPNSIPLHEQIPKIEDKLKAEWPAILAWAIEGCLLWQKEGLAKPDAVKNAVREYVDMQDIIHDWLSEKTEKCDSKVKQTDLYASYSAYIKAAGMGALGSTRLGPELKKRGYIQQKSNGVRYWYGLQMVGHVQVPSWVDNDNGNF